MCEILSSSVFFLVLYFYGVYQPWLLLSLSISKHSLASIKTNTDWAGVVCLSHLLIGTVGVKNSPKQKARTSREREEKTINYPKKRLSFTAPPGFFCRSALPYTLDICLYTIKSQSVTQKSNASFLQLPSGSGTSWHETPSSGSPLHSTGLSALLNSSPAGYKIPFSGAE